MAQSTICKGPHRDACNQFFVIIAVFVGYPSEDDYFTGDGGKA